MARFSEFERPITNEERGRLLASVPAPGPFFRKFVVQPVVFVPLAFLPFVWLFVAWRMSRFDAWLFTSIFGLITLLIIGIPGWDEWRQSRAKAARYRDVKRRLASCAVARVQRVEARTVVQIGCDLIDMFLFDLEDGRYFIAEESESPSRDWPNSSFELLTIPGNNEEFGPFCDGEKIEPEEYLKFTDVDLEKLNGESRIFRGSLDSLRLTEKEEPAS
jgi:hypothetical protein